MVQFVADSDEDVEYVEILVTFFFWLHTLIVLNYLNEVYICVTPVTPLFTRLSVPLMHLMSIMQECKGFTFLSELYFVLL